MEEIFIQNHTNPIRLDKFLKHKYKAVTQSLIEKELRLKRLKLNGSRAKSGDRVKNGDIIQMQNKTKQKLEDCKNNPPHKQNQSVNTQPENIKALKNLAARLNKLITYEDENLICINKPAGVAVQGGNKVRESIDKALPYISKDYAEARLVHRLDKETSGTLIIAKSYDMSVKLTENFRERTIDKHYKAILKGLPRYNKLICYEDLEGEIKITPLKPRDFKNKSYLEIINNLKSNCQDYTAITVASLEKHTGDYSYMSMQPITGTKHQLRRHSLSIAGPIVGDDKYGSRDGLNWLNKVLCLHASKISFELEHKREYSDPNKSVKNKGKKAKFCFKSPLPSGFMARLSYLSLD